MTLTSFAQNQEDIMLWRALKGIHNGFYIDVGAAEPAVDSVTKLFYDHGWHGINLEPQPTYFAALSAARPRDINLRLAAGREASVHLFHQIEGTGLSTFDAGIAAAHRANGWAVVQETVETLPLVEICRLHRPQGPIHFLKVDVEGAERDVLMGADFRTFRPWIVLVEATLPQSQQESHADWEPILTSQGYSFVWFDGLNRFYLSDEMKDELGKHFLVQPNVFDAFASLSYLGRRVEQTEQEVQRERDQAAGTLRDALREREQAAGTLRDALREREQAAGTLRDALREREQAAGTLREAQTIAQQGVEAMARAAHEAAAASQQAANCMREMHQMACTLDETVQKNNAALTEQIRLREEAQQAARHAEVHVAMLLGSTCWRVTAPLRIVRHLAPAKRLFPVFRGGARLVQAGGSKLAQAVAPNLVERLARRRRQCTPPLPTVSVAVLPANDLTPDEARLYRQLIAASSAVVASA